MINKELLFTEKDATGDSVNIYQSNSGIIKVEGPEKSETLIGMNEDDVKRLIICTFSAIKGGVGKTTLTFNFGEWLASKGYKVLLIDADHSCNLTQTYNIYTNENTVANIFTKNGEVDIHNVSDNVSLIAGYMKLDEIETEIENKANKNMILYMWLEDNYEPLNLSQFDFILIDCHPDFGTATKNAIAISHSIISPIIPGKDEYDAKFNLEQRLSDFRSEIFDFRTKESYITAKLFFVANKLKKNTRSSKQLLSALENENNILAYIPDREVVNQSRLQETPLSKLKENSKIYNDYKDFFATMENQFENMLNTLKANMD